MSTRKTTPAAASSFVYEKILLETDRFSTGVDLAAVTTDLDIYEHLDKPYLTAYLTFVDTKGIFTGIDILGGEKITVSFRSTRDDGEDIQTITKKFYLDRVVAVERANSNTEMIGLHLIEDLAFISNLLNVNQSYTGVCREIIQKISNDFLNKEVVTLGNDYQDLFKVIIPNLNPLEAMCWIKNKATTKNGYPFYLYSSLYSDNLRFHDLGSMLQETVINPNVPFSYWEAQSQSDNPIVARRTIKSFSYMNTESLFSIIKNGNIGAEYNYINTYYNKVNQIKFDVVKDLFTNLLESGLQANQKNVQYSPLFKHNEKSLNQLQSRRITQIGGSGAYISDGYNRSYGEEFNDYNYKVKITARAMMDFLKKSPMNIVIDGADFINGDQNSTLGKSLRISFLTSGDPSKNEIKLDSKKSGDYIIYATRHMFKKEKYDISLSCVKLANYDKAV